MKIVRIVKLTFREECIESFNQLFAERKEKIRNQAGCTSLHLWQSIAEHGVFFTYSHWQSEAHLNAYRDSELFADTWQKVKQWFGAKPEAWSVIEKEIVE